ncbi:hypothetical protein DPMN_106604 [Dreissena polymorpha]|uniref:Peptidase S1 domain-containing protein n=1 Tax=Dreissena polymorpha TaxID=45954 RepID=A0A9D4K5A6_DREPO|nr:hypothetical protein DPMN_106604 [Dreissena polymorpha]
MPHVFEVLAGTTSRERLSKQPFQRVRVEKIYLNPSMRRLENGQIDWDMALLKLSSAVKFGDFVQPICLPEISAPVPTNLQCFLAGWGYINTKSGMNLYLEGNFFFFFTLRVYHCKFQILKSTSTSL